MAEPIKENVQPQPQKPSLVPPGTTVAQPGMDTSPKGVFLRAVKARIGGDRKHGWGADDSMAVITALWQDNTGEAMPDDYATQVKRVINPSAFRQALEDANALDKAPKKIKGDLATLL